MFLPVYQNCTNWRFNKGWSYTNNEMSKILKLYLATSQREIQMVLYATDITAAVIVQKVARHKFTSGKRHFTWLVHTTFD